MDLFEWLEQKGFINQNNEFIGWNENDEEIEDSIEKWAKENCEQYDIDSEHVFDSPGLEIYCYAVSYVKCGEVHANLISCYLC